MGNAALRPPAAVMVNLLGYENAENDYLVKRQQLATLANTYVYWYDKKNSRPGRKLGHVTVLLDRVGDADAIAQQIESIWYS